MRFIKEKSMTKAVITHLGLILRELYNIANGTLQLHFYLQKAIESGPDYGTGIIGKCLGPTTLKGPTKDGCIIF